LAGLVRDAAGSLYGTTAGGGSADGAGTVFMLSSGGTETLLHVFTGPDGGEPESTLVQDVAGNLYGATAVGGSFDNGGTVFKLNTLPC